MTKRVEEKDANEDSQERIEVMEEEGNSSLVG